MAGNINIVRIPSETSDVLDWLIAKIYEILAEYNSENEQIFCRYDSNSNFTSDISSLSDLRMIWGGDDKVNLISSYPIRPDGISLGFPNRNSFCILSSEFYSKMENDDKNRLAEKLYNDICLLYTSPSPRDGLLSRMPSSA